MTATTPSTPSLPDLPSAAALAVMAAMVFGDVLLRDGFGPGVAFAQREPKAIDGQETPVNGILVNRLSAVRGPLALTPHLHDPHSPIWRMKGSLPADEAPLLQDADIEAAAGRTRLLT